jgi:hypothetical protein
MIERTDGLTGEEKKTARERILHKAKEMGVETKDWKVASASQSAAQQYGPVRLVCRLEAMSLAMPDVPDHPNRTPFSGVLMKLDEPSDYAVGGAEGHKIVIPKEVARKALPSLLGMAVDCTATFKGHDPQQKMGIITGAHIKDKELPIEGFFYAKDFPDQVAFIKKNKNLLGFSWEANSVVRNINEDPWVLKEITFTGAAVLYKADAAYTTTSLAASAAPKENEDMDALKKKIDEALGRIEAMEKMIQKEVKDAKANKDIIDKVHPHVEACKACAEAMRAAGMGLHPKRGHVAILHKMAAHMHAEASMGRIPHEVPYHVFHDTDYMHANADVEANGEATKMIEGLKAEMANLCTVVKDLQASAFNNARGPERKTITPEIKALLDKFGLQASAEKGELKIEEVDRVLAAAGIKGEAAMTAKCRLIEGGVLQMR